MKFFFVFQFTILLLYFISTTSTSKITSLPNYQGPNITQYSGYIETDKKLGINLFYWLIESLNHPKTAPLVIWLQGGPGCSSLYGLFEENGPFRVQLDGTVTFTDLSFINFANMLYIESPPGVGFSYSGKPEGYVNGDNRTADLNYRFLELFLQEYPVYSGRDFWITGESYGGVYVPTLAYRVLTGPNGPLRTSLQGLIIGNPVFRCTTTKQNLVIQFNHYYWHGLISQFHYANWTESGCNFNPEHIICVAIFIEAQDQIGEIYQQVAIQPSLDPDDLYQDFCTGNGTLEYSKEIPGTKSCDNVDVGTITTNYLNQPNVQKAIFAKPTTWESCSDLDYDADAGPMNPYYETFFNLNPDLHIMIYSGDVDIATVPFPFTMTCLHELNRPVVEFWRPWYVNGATVGYVEVYDQYTYATVKGAGHEVPLYQPLNAFNLFSRFISDQRLTDENVLTKTPISKGSMPMRQGQVLRQYRQIDPKNFI